MLEQFIKATAWEMTPPSAYGVFHVSFMIVGFSLCFLCAFSLRKISEKNHRRLLFSVGLLLALSELYKQLFYYYQIGNGSYQWWIFPFQLCSVPMYLCLLAVFLKPGKLLEGIYAFLTTYNLLGGAIAFLEPSGLCHPYWTLTLHAFLWHMLLVFVGIYLIASGKGCKNSEAFRHSVFLFLVLCGVAFTINLVFRKLSDGTINMFFVGPSNNPLIVFKSIASAYGWYVATLLYIPSITFGAWVFYRLIGLYYQKYPVKL